MVLIVGPERIFFFFFFFFFIEAGCTCCSTILNQTKYSSSGCDWHRWPPHGLHRTGDMMMIAMRVMMVMTVLVMRMMMTMVVMMMRY